MRKLTQIYRSKKRQGTYLYVEKDKALSELPEALLHELGKLELSMTLLITSEKKLAVADPAKVLSNINEKGFYLQLPPKPEDYMQHIPNSKITSRPI